MSAPGTLWVVATPIGHLDDLTLRALRVLEEADAVLAEDTRHSKKLLAHHGIQTPLRSLHAHTPDAKIAALVEELAAGASFALVSDAGTPIVSDPGIRLVAAARERGLPVTTAPGPSAVLAALTLAGLRADRFRFVGFLPRSGGKRTAALDELAADPAAQVLFESPRRLGRLLTDLAPRLGERRLAVCRELTKLHEEVRRGTLGDLAAHYAEAGAPKGEIVIVVGPPEKRAALCAHEVDAMIENALQRASLKDAVAEVVSVAGLPRREIYARALELSGAK